MKAGDGAAVDPGSVDHWEIHSKSYFDGKLMMKHHEPLDFALDIFGSNVREDVRGPAKFGFCSSNIFQYLTSSFNCYPASLGAKGSKFGRSILMKFIHIFELEWNGLIVLGPLVLL